MGLRWMALILKTFSNELLFNVYSRGGHRQNFPDRLIGWAQAIIVAFHLINGGPPP